VLKKVYVIGVLLALVVSMGCITIDYSAEQEFREDGTSTIVIDEYIGFDRESLDSYSGMGGTDSEEPSTIAAMLMLEYYTTEDYANSLCSLMDSDIECEGRKNGYMHVEAELEPGDYYIVEKETDWVGMKEVITYEIEMAPMAMYYVYENHDEEEVQEMIKDNAVNYALSGIDEHLTKDFYCEEYGYPDVLCEVSSISDGKATVELTGDSYGGPVNVKWIGCSDKSYSNFIYVYNNSEAKAMFGSTTTIDETLAYEDAMTKTVDCPAKPKTIVVAYESESYYSEEMEEDLAVFEVASKEEIKDNIEEELTADTGSLNSGLLSGSMDTSDVDADDMFLNFKKAEIAGVDIEQLSEASGATALYNMEIDVEYRAKFPNTVTGAEIDRDELKVRNNVVTVEMDDFERTSGDYLIVTTEKYISPLGSFTWVLIGGIIVLIVMALLVKAFRK